jgi:hypothetical protein
MCNNTSNLRSFHSDWNCTISQCNKSAPENVQRSKDEIAADAWGLAQSGAAGVLPRGVA